MKFSSPVVNEVGRQRFASKATIAFAIGLVVAVLVLFFPKQDLLGDIYRQSAPSIVTAEYLGDLLAIYPTDVSLQLLLANEYIKLNELKKADTLLQAIGSIKNPSLGWRKVWLLYQLQRAQVFAMPEHSARRALATLNLKKEIQRLASVPLNSQELLELSKDALSLGEIGITKHIYVRLKDHQSVLSIEDSVKTAEIAIGVGDYRNSADFYFHAQNITPELDLKRRYFQNGLRALQQGNLVNEALREAQVHMANLNLDKTSLMLVAKLALAANQPQLAEVYLQRALKLKRGTE